MVVVVVAAAGTQMPMMNNQQQKRSVNEADQKESTKGKILYGSFQG